MASETPTINVTKEQYDEAVVLKDNAQKTINEFFRQKRERFELRLKENPIFTDDELFYSASSLCPCGHGLAYPKDCGPSHYWDCSAILKGIADKNVKHTDQLPFAFYDVKGEGERNGTTRGVFRPKPEVPEL